MINHWDRQAVYIVMSMALGILLTIGIGQAFADPILVSQSTDDFYSTGGTLVSGCMGQGCSGSTVSFGSTSGTNTWGIVGRVFANDGGTTFAYTLLNNSLTQNISSFHILNNGSLGAGIAPPGWSFSQTEAWWSWETFAPPSNGVAQTGSLGGFSVTLANGVPVVFNGTIVTVSDGESTVLVHSGNDRVNGQWMVTAPGAPVPEPASLLLLGSGLAGFGAWRRGKRKA